MLPEASAWLDQGGRFPAPRWERFIELSEHLDDETHRQMMIRAIDDWSERLRIALGDGYEIIDTSHFVLVSGADSARGDLLGRALERARERILAHLPGVAVERPYPRHLAVAFEDHDVFLEYVSQFYPDGGEYGIPGGLHVPDGLGHFLIPPESVAAQEAAIMHELTHVMLADRDLPAWLDEGVAQAMEIAAGLRYFSQLGREVVEDHRQYWNEERLRRFWAGESFFDIDEGQRLSYSLAEFIVKSLPENESRVLEFIRCARADDSGFAAAREVLDVDLAELAAPLTGLSNEIDKERV